MTMALLLLSMRRCPCCCQAGIVTLVTMASSPLICDSVVSLVAMSHCHPQASIVALVAMVSSSSSMHRHPCRHHNGIVALIAMAFLPLMRRHLCHCCNGSCCPCRDGISAVVKLAYPLNWHHCPCNKWVVATIDAQASLLSSSWHRHPRCNDVAVVSVQESLQSRHLCHCCNNVVALIPMVLLPS
jgi:hypothetical protein